MIHELQEIDEWEVGDSIEVCGTLCKNPNDAWVTFISGWYSSAPNEPVDPTADAKEMFENYPFLSFHWEMQDLVDFINCNFTE
jgi:hypothetical protein